MRRVLPLAEVETSAGQCVEVGDQVTISGRKMRVVSKDAFGFNNWVILED